MKEKTDEEILAIKTKLEKEGYEFKSTNPEWITKYREHHAPIKIQLTKAWDKFKRWVIIHPRTTFVYVLLLLLMGLLLIGCASLVKYGAQLIKGEVVNALSFDQVTGLLVILFGLTVICFFLLTFGSVAGSSSTIKDDEAAYKRKLRRQQLALNSQNEIKEGK